MIDNILTFSEETVLQSKPPFSVNLQRLDEISARVASRSQMRGAEVARFVSVFQDADVPQQAVPWLWVISIIVVSIVIGSLWPIWLRIIKFCFACIQTSMSTIAQPSEVSTNQKPNGYGTEL